MAEHPELIENSFVEYLKSIATSPWNDDLMDGGELRIFPGESDTSLNGAFIRCYVPNGMGEEDPPLSGNRWAEVRVELLTPVSQPIDASGQGTYDSVVLENHKANAAALSSAILDNELPDLLTAAISGFCCFGISERQPIREQTESHWKSGYEVKLLTCPSHIDS